MNPKNSKILVLSLIVVLSIATNVSALVWPKPKELKSGSEIHIINRCNLLLPQNLLSHMEKRLNVMLKNVFKAHEVQDCNVRNLLKGSVFPLRIQIEDPTLRPPREQEDQRYQITITQIGGIHLQAYTYVGYVWGLETLTQLIKEDLENKGQFKIQNLPIYLSDEPAFSYRGVMIDTARHYLSKAAIIRTIDGLAANKLNVLHWHITDDQSFPLYLPSYPNITNTGAYNSNQTYSVQDVKEIVDHATQSGVRVIPEIDSPGHCRSWGQNAALQDMVILCPGGEHYNHQLDPTMDLTYEVNGWIWNDIQNMFPDNYVHMGGDEVFGSCWDQRPSIKDFMNKNGLKDYQDLQIYYRNRQKNSLKQGKTAIYWANEDIHFSPDPNDIIQFWGQYNTTNLMLDTPNKLIISSVDILYINVGFGFIWGNPFQSMITWKDIYAFNPIPPGFTQDRILGAEVTLWQEVSNEYTLDNYLWPRASSFAERVWNPVNDTMANVAQRLVNMINNLQSRGFEPSPITTQYCELHINECFQN